MTRLCRPYARQAYFHPGGQGVGTAQGKSSCCTMITKKNDARVVVVGAGISGIACARELREKGVDVVILEARDRIGGRIHTVNWGGVALDVGASWIHGLKGNPVYQLAQDLGVETTNSNLWNCSVYDKGHSLGYFSKVLKYWRYLGLQRKLEKLGATSKEDLSIHEAFLMLVGGNSRRSQRSSFETMFLHVDTSENYGSDASTLSLKEWHQDVDFEGVDVVFPNGYAELLEKASKGLDIRLEHPVDLVEWGDCGVKIHSGENFLAAEAVVLTVPLGVLKSGDVRFKPDLPAEKVRSIQNLHMGYFNKVILKFSHVFWPNRECFAFTVGLDEPNMSLIINFEKYLKVPILVGLLGGKFAKESERMSDESMVALTMARLREAFGGDIPDPVSYFRTKWCEDPYSMGAYSSIPVGSSAQDRVKLGDNVSNRLFWAGEAASVKYAATVHGAYLSGVETAQEILASSVGKC
ncbi:hypothetical protein BSKO_08432 [Bryopsis sp. KO-2023]|nr:hypothetical protein BSKO_08432 [Bryopsis sp. KO-2023]